MQKRKVDIEELRKVAEVPRGSFIRIAKASGGVLSRVYILEEYDRSERAYWLQDAEDISNGRFLKADRLVQVGFTY